jgi:hypothetical protein
MTFYYSAFAKQQTHIGMLWVEKYSAFVDWEDGNQSPLLDHILSSWI